ncbi:MAG: hypothetical protein NC212_01720 [Staphylococcus sp.]|nr:hypothetical protein [Staphylococcus sp.]
MNPVKIDNMLIVYPERFIQSSGGILDEDTDIIFPKGEKVRTFFSVGMGLFAVEKINDVSIVYDCGSLPKIQRVNNAVNRIKGPFHNLPLVAATHDGTPKIDILFISHFHLDHINGIKALLTTCKVSCVILPMLPTLSRFMNYIINRGNDRMRDFFVDPVSYLHNLSPSSKIITVEMPDDDILPDHRMDNDEPKERKIDERATTIQELKETISPIYSFSLNANPEWIYRIFNPKLLSIHEEQQILTSLGLDSGAKFSDLEKKWISDPTAFPRALNAVGIENSKFNEYSMCLWTGTGCATDGCLFLGDYNAKIRDKMAALKSAYADVWEKTEIVQLPHHGSTLNFSKDLVIKGAAHLISHADQPYSRNQPKPAGVMDKIKQMYETVYTTFEHDVIFSVG